MTVLSPKKALGRLYVARLRRKLKVTGSIPVHIGLIMDGNRRWARGQGFDNPSTGHRYGAEHLEELLTWASQLGIRNVTVYVCSTENLARRASPEVAFLMGVIEEMANRIASRQGNTWRVAVAGTLGCLPHSTVAALTSAVAATRSSESSRQLTLAIGYGGRQEIVDAVRTHLHEQAGVGASLAELARTLEIDDISRNVYAPELPDPDLIIRTSGEQRSSNFLLWQGTHAEYFFCDAYWPAFREIDFLRIVRSYAARGR